MKTLLSILACMLLFTGTALAQYSPVLTLQSDLSIIANPTNPAPGTLVTLSAQSATMDLSTANFVWRVNGKSVPGGKSITVTVGNLGTPMNIDLSVSGSAAAITLVPEKVDLIVDANSYAPPFYRGRTLPSPGSKIRAQAMPQLVTSSGKVFAPSDLVYTWSQDGSVLGSASGLGRSSAQLDAPPLYGATAITVEARSQSGTYRASASVQLSSIDPSITLYVDHPLFGIEYWRALSARASVADIETSFVAVPYFIPFASASDPRLNYAWSINGSRVAASSTATNELTVNAKGVSNAALLSTSLTSPADYFLDASKQWNVSFGQQITQGSRGTSVTPADAFHGQ
jgi:hypothetical protein